MNGPSISIHTDDDDDIMELRSSDFSRPSFQIPGRSMGIPGMGTDALINRRKVSSDVISLASSDVSGSGSGSGSDSGSDSSDASFETDSSRGGNNPRDGPLRADAQGMFGGRPNVAQSMGVTMGSDGGPSDYLANRLIAERARAESELNEKKEIMYQMDRLESKGYRLPRKFSLQSDLEEMRVEFNRVVREKEVDASIRFQRKTLMALVTGIEFLNTRFDPFDVKLDGWSEQVHENVTDYDDIFEELHEKYKSSGKKMAPELRLLMSVSGSAFMFHLTNSMFKQQPLPGVEQVLRSNPELMRQFQAAAATQMGNLQQATSMGSGAGQQQQQQQPSQQQYQQQQYQQQQYQQQQQQAPQPANQGMGGMFGMIGNLFGAMNNPQPTNLARAPAMQAPPQQATAPQQYRPATRENVETIIQDIHREVRSRPPSSSPQIETLSMSDEEITSIIEDTADMVGLYGDRPKKGRKVNTKRTLDL